MEISLEGKVALVTGAGPNIGSGIALALARYGAKVACNDLVAEAAEASARRITRHDGDAIAIPLPHPSGASSWLNVPANKERVAAAVELVRAELARI